MAQLICARKTVKMLTEQGDVFDQDFKSSQAILLGLEEDFGDWQGEVLDYGNEDAKTELPNYVCMAIGRGDLQTVIDWIGLPADRKKLNAGWKDNNDFSMLFVAMMVHNLDLISILSVFTWKLILDPPFGSTICFICCMVSGMVSGIFFVAISVREA